MGEATKQASVTTESHLGREPVGDRWDELVKQDRVHRAVYTDPSIFEAEMTKIFASVWVYIAHESEVPVPNSFKTGYLGRRPVIVTRDGGGELHILFNRCRHRGATVCREERGRAKSFTCPYHGWTYTNTGKLSGVPWRKGYAPEARIEQNALAQAPRVESYRGFIFTTLNLDAPPLVDYLGHARALLDQWLDRYPGGELIVRNGAHRMICRANWKLMLDNGPDGYHPSFSHRSLLTTASRLGDGKDMQYFGQNPDRGPMYVQYLGNGHTFLDQRPNYSGAGALWRQQRPQPGREVYEAELRSELGEDADRMLDLAIGSQMNLNIFPNLLLIGNQVQVLEPISVDRTQLTWYATSLEGVPSEVNTLRMRTQEDFPSFGEPDDLANFEECQRGLGIPEIEWVLVNRGFGIPDRQWVNEDGVVTAPVTDELPMRGYYDEWKRLMRAKPEVSVL